MRRHVRRTLLSSHSADPPVAAHGRRCSRDREASPRRAHARLAAKLRGALCVAAAGLALAPTPASAGDAEDAIHATEAAALDARDAANAGKAAAASSKQAADTADTDGNASASAAQAAADDTAATKAAGDANTAANNALFHAKAAQAAQRAADAAMDPLDWAEHLAEAAEAANKAKAEADKARQAADAAKKAAADAAQKAQDAENRRKNDAANGLVVPPTPPQKKAHDDQRQEAKDNTDFDDGVIQSSKAIDSKAASLAAAQDDYDRRQGAKDGAGLPPPTHRLRVEFGAHDFFDVFVDLDPSPMPYPGSPGDPVVPEFRQRLGDTARLFVRLVNDNPFDVVLTAIEGTLFGDAVSFTPFIGAQTVAADSDALVAIGTLAYTGASGGFSVANFDFATDSGQPGLGPVVTVDAAVIPTPRALDLTLLALALLAGARRSAGGGAWDGRGWQRLRRSSS